MTEHASLTAALSAFQAELPDVSKGSTNPAFKSKYADLADVVKVVLPALAKHGLAWVTAPDITEHGMVLRYELRHTSGDAITGSWPLPDGAKAQELGSWITYGRRYTLGAVTGIAPDEDDDGNAAKGAVSPPKRESARDKIDAAVTAIHAATDPVKLDAIEAHAKSLGIDGVADVKSALTAKRAELGPSGVDRWGPVAEVPA
jgi:hypothetical protein